jgi:hypothetical protein
MPSLVAPASVTQWPGRRDRLRLGLPGRAGGSSRTCRAPTPRTTAGIAGLLASVGLLAAYLPARAATRVSPVDALRDPI